MALNRLNGNLSARGAYNIPPASDRSTQLAPVTETQGSTSLQQEAPEHQEQKMDLTVKVPKRENASIENVAISLGAYDGVSIDLFGGNGLASDNMKRAISGMKRDHILHEYQYFVGSKDMSDKTSNVIADTEYGRVLKH